MVRAFYLDSSAAFFGEKAAKERAIYNCIAIIQLQ
jgi:hypothetical protein